MAMRREASGQVASATTAQLKQNRSLLTLMFQLLAMVAIPYGEGAALINAIYGGGPRTIFVGWIATLILHEAVALSLAELSSIFPTASGPYYWTFQLLLPAKTSPGSSDGSNPPADTAAEQPPKAALALAYVSGWLLLLGNWVISLSINFGFAQYLSAVIYIRHGGYMVPAWLQLLIFYGVCLLILALLVFGNRYLPLIDGIATLWNALALVVIMLTLCIYAGNGRRSASVALGEYDSTLSGWGDFSFFIGMLPPAYTFAAMGLICSMAEEVYKPRTHVPIVLAITIPISAVIGMMFIVPLCVTLPPLKDILMFSAGGQALPYIFHRVINNMAGSLCMNIIVLFIILFCSIGVSLSTSRYTWAFARDGSLPFFTTFSKIDKRFGVPTNAMYLMTLFEMVLGLVSLGNTTAFNAFVSMATVALQVSYGIPIVISMWKGRRQVSHAEWKMPSMVGWAVNTIGVMWVTFECFLFSLPVTRPVRDAAAMNYASVVLVGFIALVGIWYCLVARKVFKGPLSSGI